MTDTLGGSSSDGGSTGSGSASETVAEIPPQLYNIPYGDTALRSFTVENIVEQDVTADVRMPDTTQCDLFRVETRASAFPPQVNGSSEYGRTGSYSVEGGLYLGDRVSVEPGGEDSMPEESRFEELANSNGTVRCVVETSSEQGGMNDLVLEVEPGVDPLAPLRNFRDEISTGSRVSNVVNNVFVGVRDVAVILLFWVSAVSVVWWRFGFRR